MNKQPQVPKKNEVSLVPSSAAEYLTFVAATGSAQTSVEMRYEDENIWLTQKMMATVYEVSVPAINQHLKRIFADNEREEAAVIKQYLTNAADGKNYQVKIDGRLVTQQADAVDATDSGLRFAAVDDGNFVCPQCGAVVAEDFFA